MFVYLILSVLVFILFPSTSFAWGPGTHIEIALSLLEKLALFAPAVRAVIAGREEWFIYGNVAADIVVGKKYAGPLHHCHNWRVGHDILRAARTEREEAAAYGYLAHLAADVIAHNYYIPYMMIKSYRARLLSHTYWEMRFDLHVRLRAWNEMTNIILRDFSPFDRLLEKVLRRALFSFKTSRRIFSGILVLHRFNQFHKAISVYAKKSRFKLDKSDCSNYMRLATRFALDYLSSPDVAVCLQSDPSGREKLEMAGKLRNYIRKSLRQRIIKRSEIDNLIIVFREKLYKGICEPQIVLPPLDFRLKHLNT